MPSISGLVVYPLKGARGIPLQQATLLPTGLAYDRQWMIVKEANGRFVSQREVPKLALVEVSLPPETLQPGWGGKLPPDAALSVSAPGQPILQVPLVVPIEPQPIKTVTVWEWTGAAADEGDDAAHWFSAYIGYPVRLVRYLGKDGVAAGTAIDEARRQTDPKYALGGETKFSDGYPMLMTTESALADLNSRLPEPLKMDRFRPNIIVADAPAWWEDSFRSVLVLPKSQQAGAGAGSGAPQLELISVKPCARCKVTTVNQQTAQVGDEPLDTLHEFRSGKVLGLAAQHKSWTHSVIFGANLVTTSTGSLSVGDELHATGPQLNPLAPAVLT